MPTMARRAFVPTIGGLVCCSVLCVAAAGMAQDAVPADQAVARAERIKELQAQAARIRSELAALKQTKGNKTSAIAKKPPTAKKPPEGVTRSAAPREEFTEQPTRHMRESLESLPGMTVRQGDGPRDFNISIRGSGAGGGR
ncbi:MAG: Plug domain-containing protein [Nitrospira sp.]|nr:Plug domain-containing protein [Nitrospira sp.]